MSTVSPPASHTSQITGAIELVAVRCWHGLASKNHSANAFECVNVLERIAFRRNNVALLADGNRAQIIQAEQIRGRFRAEEKRLLRRGAKAHVGHDFVAHSSLPRLVTLIRTGRDFHAGTESRFESLQLALPD